MGMQVVKYTQIIPLPQTHPPCPYRSVICILISCHAGGDCKCFSFSGYKRNIQCTWDFDCTLFFMLCTKEFTLVDSKKFGG